MYESEDGNIVGTAHDQTKNVYWAFTDYAIFRYKVSVQFLRTNNYYSFIMILALIVLGRGGDI